MTQLLIIVAVVAVVVVAAVVLSRRKRRDLGSPTRSPAAVAPPPVRPVSAGPHEPVEAEARRAEKEVQVAAAVAEPATPEAHGADAVAEEAPADAAPEAPKAPPSEGELRSRVNGQLKDSARILGELRKASTGAAGLVKQVAPGTLDLMEEGLNEVRALADKNDWSQAKDKGDALHAQLSLMLQRSRRSQSA